MRPPLLVLALTKTHACCWWYRAVLCWAGLCCAGPHTGDDRHRLSQQDDVPGGPHSAAAAVVGLLLLWPHAQLALRAAREAGWPGSWGASTQLVAAAAAAAAPGLCGCCLHLTTHANVTRITHPASHPSHITTQGHGGAGALPQPHSELHPRLVRRGRRVRRHKCVVLLLLLMWAAAAAAPAGAPRCPALACKSAGRAGRAARHHHARRAPCPPNHVPRARRPPVVPQHGALDPGGAHGARQRRDRVSRRQ